MRDRELNRVALVIQTFMKGRKDRCRAFRRKHHPVCSGWSLPLLQCLTSPNVLQNVFPEEEKGGGGAADLLEGLQEPTKGLMFR